MGIEYIEIRNAETDLLGIIDTAQSVIWRSKYYGVGDFEIYVQASPETIALLQVGNYVTRPDDLEVGIIESVHIADDTRQGTMVTAVGRFAKSLLERRLIYKLAGTVNTPTILRGNVETEVRRIVTENAINCPFDSKRNIPLLSLGPLAGIPLTIVDDNGKAAQKQVSYENLLAYTDALLEEYGLGSTVILDVDARKLLYVIYAGVDRSVDNTTGEVPIVFSKEFDNLTSSSYEYSTVEEKNVALIGGAGEGLERFYSLVGSTQSGIARREVFVDAASINRTYKDDSDEEQQYSDTEYTDMLNAAGRQQLAASTARETFGGVLDVMNSPYQYNRDFALGDIVTEENHEIGKYANVRVLEVLEAQDENGYSIEATSQT